MLFEPVRKTQDAMFFIKTSNGMWMPCGPKQEGAVQISMQELAAEGQAAKVVAIPLKNERIDIIADAWSDMQNFWRSK